MPEIDYRDLLKRYIKHVGYCEGITFLRARPAPHWQEDHPRFSEEEWTELQRLDEEGGA